MLVEDHHFYIPLGVGDDRHFCHFASSAGRGGDGEQRSSGFGNLVIAHVVGKRLGIGREDRDRLACVEWTAATNGDYRLRTAAAVEREAVADILNGGIGLNAVEDCGFDAAFLKWRKEPCDHAGLHHEGIGDHEHTLRAQAAKLRQKLSGSAAADDYAGWNVE